MNLNSKHHTSRKLSYDDFNVDIKVDIVYINESGHSGSPNSIIIQDVTGDVLVVWLNDITTAIVITYRITTPSASSTLCFILCTYIFICFINIVLFIYISAYIHIWLWRKKKYLYSHRVLIYACKQIYIYRYLFRSKHRDIIQHKCQLLIIFIINI